MRKITLVIMAAGMGSRFGGLKQIEPIDPEGHIIIDFSLFDAWRAGFRDVVFIIKREMEAEFRECIGDRMEQYFHVSYVYQDLDRLPEGIEAPEGRTKPWGTGHALACCKGVVNGPFAVINADDFYGRTAFSEIRFGAATAAEDEKDLSKMEMSLDRFRVFTRGYVRACPGLTGKELEMLPMGAKTMTMECGVRFLTDYLDGDHYFAVHREGQNLDRCRTQFKLVADMEKKWDEIIRTISTQR